jgi:hypothetical protein
MPDDPSFPELARSLRSLGAARDAASQAAHDAIFTPLIDARVRAAHAGEGEVVGIFSGIVLSEQIERGVVEAAIAGAEPAALARARAASARELIEPLRAALAALDDCAAAATLAGLASPEGNAWLAGLRRVFGAADDACTHLARLLSSPRSAEQPSRRWFGPRKG